ncbi:MAG: VIT domain-containing protein, partial [Planctomycetota bacterium]
LAALGLGALLFNSSCAAPEPASNRALPWPAPAGQPAPWSYQGQQPDEIVFVPYETQSPFISKVPALSQLSTGRYDDDGKPSPIGPYGPGTGVLIAMVNGMPQSLGVERTDVDIHVVGPVASGTLKQTFNNPTSASIEAKYVFPLPDDAAVHDFILKIGDRTIRGVVRERKEAEELYEAAKVQGYTASLLNQHRPNVFEQKVANIAPRSSIAVELTYLEPVDYRDGWQTVAFPLVVGPRYFPVGHTPNAQTQSLGQERRPADHLTLDVHLDAGLDVSAIECPTHSVTIRETKRGAEVSLRGQREIPNADFELRWKVSDESRMRTSLVRQGDHALLTLYPPSTTVGAVRRGLDHVFVLDTSGSMTGEPIELLQEAMHSALSQLDEQDTFEAISFGKRARKFSKRALPATRENVRRARRWVDARSAKGGTEMLPALKSILAQPGTQVRPRIVTLISDGLIGNENEILQLAASSESDCRFFCLAIGLSCGTESKAF